MSVRAIPLLALAACAHVRPPVPIAQQPPPLWPVAVRIMTWTSEGVVQVGELPDHPATPATPWYVEPERELDAATFRRLVAALRSEHVPGLSLRGQPALPLELLDLPELTALVLDDTPVGDAELASVHAPLTRI